MYESAPCDSIAKCLRLQHETIHGTAVCIFNEVEIGCKRQALPQNISFSLSHLNLCWISAYCLRAFLAGYFYASQSDTGVTMSLTEEQQSSSSQEALWLVYKWENLQPLAFYPSYQQEGSKKLPFQLIKRDIDAEALQDRCYMLRYPQCTMSDFASYPPSQSCHPKSESCKFCQDL